MTDTKPPAAQSTARAWWIVWGVGAGIAILFFGLWLVLYWTLAVLCARLFAWKAVAGVLAFVLLAVVAFGPGMMDRRILEWQLADQAAMEVRSEPIDLTGKTILFADAPWFNEGAGCRYVCYALVHEGGAKNVLFGDGGSWAQYTFPPGADLTKRPMYRFAELPMTPDEVKTAPLEVVLPDKIDYVVLTSHKNADVRAADRARVGHYGAGPRTVFLDFMVVPVEDMTNFDPYGAEPVVKLYKISRNAIPTPWFFGLQDPDSLHFRHQRVEPRSFLTLNMREMLRTFCGPEGRPGRAACLAFDRP